ncbi:DUF3558 domain-containing protein [Actinopolyspora mortivallis]|uniref:DUF3558 domain-containing protein n=1 Tax=Actinopolyspora mortivallis TaxID=33906 RepID=UPI0012EED7B4|nr:DUF3558 domain-containing protein [Actinopolyspora mortivallis]
MDITLRRLARLGAGVLVVVLAGCSAGAGQQDPPEGQPSSSSPETGSGMEIAHPKDAAAVDVCDLLPEEAATSLGVQQQGEKSTNNLAGSGTPACTWESREGKTKVSLSPAPGRSIRTYRQHKSEYVDYKEFEISGYSVVQANRVKPSEAGSCGMFLVAQEKQLVQSFVTLPVEQVGKTDPCSLARKALRLSVSSWPDA